MATDPRVETDGPRDGRHVHIQGVAEIGHDVDERDLGREKGVRRLLDEFGRRHAREDDRAVHAGLVELEEERPRPRAVGADHDPIRLEEIADRRALAEEFWIAGDIELALRSGQAPDRPLDPAGGPGRNGAFFDDQLVAVEQGRDRASDLLDLAKVRAPVTPRRRPDADENDVGRAHRVLRPGREFEPARLEVGGEQLAEAGLMDSRLAC